MGLVTVARADDVPEGEARRFEVDGREIAVVNLGDGQFRAIGDVCSHAHAYLHEGEVDPDFMTIECPRHGSTFDLDTGDPKSLPATVPVPVYAVKVEGDEVKVEIP
ncbi:MAG TPA: non-heme iron oxygenase ferredoxin subunit [Actinomycetota bacterium]|nr:non-heme iron oxygenase ferredoxin subunit [Actinomycetota bacterium]